jgi:hypothetical protein
MFEDINGYIALATNPMATGKTKHIDIHYHFIGDMVNNKTVEVQYCPVEGMLTNALIKFRLFTALHLRHVRMMPSGTYEPLATDLRRMGECWTP